MRAKFSAFETIPLEVIAADVYKPERATVWAHGPARVNTEGEAVRSLVVVCSLLLSYRGSSLIATADEWWLERMMAVEPASVPEETLERWKAEILAGAGRAIARAMHRRIATN